MRLASLLMYSLTDDEWCPAPRDPQCPFASLGAAQIQAIFRNVTTAAGQTCVDFRLFGRMVDEYEFFRRCFSLPGDAQGADALTEAQVRGGGTRTLSQRPARGCFSWN